MTQPWWAVRLASRGVAFYLRHAPVQRGKYALWQRARAFAVARVPDGPWLRTSGLTHCEYELLLGGCKEPRTVSIFRGLLRPTMAVVDVGANIGYYSLIAALQVRTVHAFEPTPALCARIEENARLNNLSNVTLHRCAVSDRTGTAILHESP